MSLAEFLVILFGLWIGYWIVSRIFTGKQRAGEQSTPKSEQDFTKEGFKSEKATADAWHEILNVSASATADEIRRSYKKLMSQYHPDKVDMLGDELKALAEKKSKEITKAYREAMRVRDAAA